MIAPRASAQFEPVRLILRSSFNGAELVFQWADRDEVIAKYPSLTTAIAGYRLLTAMPERVR